MGTDLTVGTNIESVHESPDEGDNNQGFPIIYPEMLVQNVTAIMSAKRYTKGKEQKKV